MYWSVGQIPTIPISILPEIGAHCKTPPPGKRRKQHECSGHQRRKLFPEVSASQSRHRRAARQGPLRAHRHRRQVHLQAPARGQGGHQGRRRRHAHPQRSHRGCSERPRGREERRHRLHEGDRRGRSPRGPRRREVRQVRHHHRRGHGRHRGVQSPRAPAQPRQHHRHQGLPAAHARRAHGRRVRHRLPSDDAARGLHLCHSL